MDPEWEWGKQRTHQHIAAASSVHDSTRQNDLITMPFNGVFLKFCFCKNENHVKIKSYKLNVKKQMRICLVVVTREKKLC